MRALRIAFIALVGVSVVTLIVMELWNVLMPAIFKLPVIGFWQALGLLLLSKLLFGGFRPRGAGPRWRRRMRQRWEQMTPEERERFKEGMRGCSWGRREAEVPSRHAEAGV